MRVLARWLGDALCKPSPCEMRHAAGCERATMQPMDANTGTRPVAEQQAFDVAALQAWMAPRIEGFAGPLAVSQFKGGQSNPTFKLETSAAP